MRTRHVLAFTFAFLLLTFDLPRAAAQPTQEEVFRSIKENVDRQSDQSAKGLAVLLALTGGVIVALLAGSRIRQRRSTPQPLHHPGRLLREVLKSVPLKKKELKQLKQLAEASRQTGTDAVQSPLTLILCPSVLARTLKSHPAKVDRAVVAGIVRKMGVAGK